MSITKCSLTLRTKAKCACNVVYRVRISFRIIKTEFSSWEDGALPSLVRFPYIVCDAYTVTA